ncbi:sec-independent translocase [Streptomyces spiramenti]|uniref:Sec-independent protein translocase protein TatB n=1 Tax=Streptomyces spiramenti TaxID=2720606 RepID=A0ABX1AMW2_9ACTN|nr:Sec-independent protein translocase subunit TatB [Streptomyces spiramenti]
MFFDIGPLNFLILLILAILLFGPDKLPKLIQDAVGFLQKVRAYSDNAKRDIRSELGPEFKDFEFEDLHPKRFAQKHLMSKDELGLRELRDSLDVRKELTEVRDSLDVRKELTEATDAVNGRARPSRVGSDDDSADGRSVTGSTAAPGDPVELDKGFATEAEMHADAAPTNDSHQGGVRLDKTAPTTPASAPTRSSAVAPPFDIDAT